MFVSKKKQNNAATSQGSKSSLCRSTISTIKPVTSQHCLASFWETNLLKQTLMRLRLPSYDLYGQIYGQNPSTKSFNRNFQTTFNFSWLLQPSAKKMDT